MNIDLANFSTDLRRISYWYIEGNLRMANKFLKLSREKYKKIPTKIGCYKNIWEEINQIEKNKQRQEKSIRKINDCQHYFAKQCS
jgi:hypothetical protein